MQLKREVKTAKALWSVGTEKAADRVTAAADALAEAEEAEGPTSIVQIAFRPKWIDQAKRMQAILTMAMLTEATPWPYLL